MIRGMRLDYLEKKVALERSAVRLTRNPLNQAIVVLKLERPRQIGCLVF